MSLVSLSARAVRAALPAPVRFLSAAAAGAGASAPSGAFSLLFAARAAGVAGGAAPSAPQPTGRAWRAAELRQKSFDDLHTLWFVCLRERDYLLTERLYFRQLGQMAPEGSRLLKVKRTMGGIRVVLGERARAASLAEADAERGEQARAIARSLVRRRGGGAAEGARAAPPAQAAELGSQTSPAEEMKVAVDAERQRLAHVRQAAPPPRSAPAR